MVGAAAMARGVSSAAAIGKITMPLKIPSLEMLMVVPSLSPHDGATLAQSQKHAQSIKPKLARGANKLSPRVVGHAPSSGVVSPVRAVAGQTPAKRATDVRLKNPFV